MFYKTSAVKLKYHLLAVLVVAVWGVTFVSTKTLLTAGLTPSWIFAIRFTIAWCGIWMLCLKEKGARKLFSRSLKDEMLFVLMGICGGSLYFLTENTALYCTQACNVSFIVCSAPLMTVLMTLAARKFFKGAIIDGMEDVRGRWNILTGTMLALSGMAAVIFDSGTVRLSAKGDLLALCAAACWGFYSIFMGQMTSVYGSLFATRKVFFWGLVTIIPFIAGSHPEWSVLLCTKVWTNLLFLSVVASLACFAVWNKVMSELGNVTTTNYVYLNPFFTLAAAVLFLGESLTVQSAAGCLSILAGVILAGLKK